eukprot:7816283-Alexandrium_andersonii.AAC.1
MPAFAGHAAAVGRAEEMRGCACRHTPLHTAHGPRGLRDREGPVGAAEAGPEQGSAPVLHRAPLMGFRATQTH